MDGGRHAGLRARRGRLDARIRGSSPCTSREGIRSNLSTKLSGPFTGVFAVGDLNDDGRLDLAAAMHDRVTTTDTIAVFLQRFSGGFDATPTFQLSVDGLGGASGIAIGRFSGRPFYDIAARRQGRSSCTTRRTCLP